ncbi:hypothetical protein D3C76_1354130 [compost metagenome]
MVQVRGTVFANPQAARNDQILAGVAQQIFDRLFARELLAFDLFKHRAFLHLKPDHDADCDHYYAEEKRYAPSPGHEIFLR